MKQLKLVFTSLIFFALSSNLFSQNKDTNNVDAQGIKQGYWTETDSTGTWNGQYVDGKKQASWVSYYKKGLIKEIYTYHNGIKEGLHLVFDRNGYLLEESYFSKGQLHGVTKEFSAGGRVKAIIPYRNGKLEGTREYFSPTGKHVEKAEFSNGEKNGKTQWFNNQGEVYLEQSYINGTLEGPMRSFYKSNGNIEEEGIYKNNELNGKYYRYYENGKQKEAGQYVNGKREGKWTLYDENGKEETVRYKDGKRK